MPIEEPPPMKLSRFGDGISVLVADGPDVVDLDEPAVEDLAVDAVTDPPEPDAEPEVETPTGSPFARLSEHDRRRIDGDNEITDPEALAALVASAFEARGGLDALAASRAKRGITAAVKPDGTVEAGPWHAYLCVDGIRSDDGREFAYGCFTYPDLPVSLRLLLEDEGGHWGAVTSGRIDSIVPQEIGTDDAKMRRHYAEGDFGTDTNGQLAELMVEEQTQRFISVDPRKVQYEEILIWRADPEVFIDGQQVGGIQDGDEYDIWWRFTYYMIGAATIVPIPCLPQAVITPMSMALPEAPIAMEMAPAGLPDAVIIDIETEPDADDWDTDAAIAASGSTTTALHEVPAPDPEAAATTGPPSWMFDAPEFRLGDQRLVLQADDRSYACPLTVCDPDPETGYRRVFSHVAWWECNHTGFPGQQIKPPHSAAAYAYYLTGGTVECSDGAKITGVGQITMGCGHAATSMSASQAKAHYDGGFGALQIADVRAGEDEFGPWISGVIRDEISPAELAQFMRLNLSGDWREIAGQLELVAVLAVPVPGFPIRRQLSASGLPIVEECDTRLGYEDDRCMALVAAGIVRRVDPVARIAWLEQRRTEDRLLIDSLVAERNEERTAAAARRRAEFGL